MARNAGFISRRTALAAAVVAGASLLGGFSAAAQQVGAASPPSSLCEKAIALGNAITDQYKVSAPMARSFANFAKTGCGDVDWEISTPVDKNALQEFRLRLIVLKKSATADTVPANN
jgi:hypothetical protein